IVIIEPCGVDGGEAGGIDFDDALGDRLVSSTKGDGGLHDEDLLELRLDAEAGDLTQAEGRLTAAREREQIRRAVTGSFRLEDGAETLVIVASRSVTAGGLLETAIVEGPHSPADWYRDGVQV